MLIIKSFFNYLENNFLLCLTLIVIILTMIYFSSYIRMCYYVSKLPGPRAYPIVGNALLFTGTHEEIYNNLFRITIDHELICRVWLGPIPIVFISNPKSIQELLNNHHGIEKSWIMKEFGSDLVGDSILVAKAPKWKKNRSLVVKGFSTKLLKSYFKTFVEKSIIVAKKLQQELDQKSFDILEYTSKTSMDSVCGSTMGVDINAHEGNSSYYNAVQSGLYLIYDRSFRPWKHLNFIYNWTEDYKQLQKNKKVINDLTSKIISERRKTYNIEMNNSSNELEKTVRHKPLLDYLLEFTGNNPQFSDEQLRDEINLLVMAGYETSANALAYIFLNLAAYKDIQNKVYDELYSILGDSDRVIELEELTELKYMEMVIKESMRLYATAPLLIRELTSDIHMDKYLIPKGTNCFVPIFSLHRDANIWENPLKFDPERFTPEKIQNRHPYAYIPFSAGPRNCIGTRYAMMFMKTVISTLISRYEFHTDLKIDELRFEIELSLKLIGGHQVRITPRNKN